MTEPGKVCRAYWASHACVLERGHPGRHKCDYNHCLGITPDGYSRPRGEDFYPPRVPASIHSGRPMNILVACEYSGRVRDALIKRGHAATSCDITDTEVPGPHIKGDVRAFLDMGWDMMIAFPPCTYLSNINALVGRIGSAQEDEALDFVCELLNAPIPLIALENPYGAINRRVRPSTQIIEPYYFGEPWSKPTHLWLQGLPPLVPTNRLPGGRGTYPSWVNATGRRTRETRGKDRALTFQGVADAMAAQWA